MKEVEFFRWYIPEFSSGKLYLSRYRMSVEQAQKRFPGCKPDPRTREVWSLPETPEESVIPADAPYARRSKPST